jgi:hypothetical protein
MKRIEQTTMEQTSNRSAIGNPSVFARKLAEAYRVGLISSSSTKATVRHALAMKSTLPSLIGPWRR